MKSLRAIVFFLALAIAASGARETSAANSLVPVVRLLETAPPSTCASFPLVADGVAAPERLIVGCPDPRANVELPEAWLGTKPISHL